MSAAAILALALAAAPAGPTEAARPTVPEHRLFVSLSSVVQAYLSDTRTMGGVGGGVGVRDVHRGWLVGEADVSYLFMVGNVLSLRMAGGVQRQGFWAPAATLGVTLLVGDRFSFLQPDRPLPIPGPTLKLDLVLSPLRFQTPAGIVSVLQLGAGIGTEFSWLGTSIHLGLLELAVPLP